MVQSLTYLDWEKLFKKNQNILSMFSLEDWKIFILEIKCILY